MGVFSEIAGCVFFFILLLQDVTSGDYQDICTTKTKLGTVREVTISPAVYNVEEEFVKGDPLDATVRVTSPFKPKAVWTLEKNVEIYEGHYNGYITPVPEKETGSIRAKTESEGSDTYLFSLHLDSFDQERIVFTLQLHHPCNTITIEAGVDRWRNMTGVDLPTALSVPRPFIDLSANTEARMKVGMEVDDIMEIGESWSYFSNIRKNGMLHMHHEIRSRDYVRINFLDGSRESPSRVPIYDRRASGVMVLRKWTEALGGMEAMTLRTEAELVYRGHYWRLNIWALTQVKLVNDKARPTIEVVSQAWHTNMRTPMDENRDVNWFHDSDGTRLIPFVQNGNIKPPLELLCLAEAGERTPYVAVALTHINPHGIDDGVVLDPIASAESPGWMYSIFEASSQDDKTADYICSAADGEVVTTMPFKIIITEAVKTTTDIEDVVPLNEETFTNGFTFTCKATGDPIPINIKFYKEDKTGVGYRLYAKGHYEDGYSNEIKDSDRFSIASSEGQATLTVSPGGSPYPGDDEAFRLICVGANQFTVDGAYVDFIAPHINIDRGYKN